MRQFVLPALVLASAVAIGGCLHAPMPWSPDGKWLAYTVEVRPIEPLLRTGWIFDSPTTPPPAPARPSSPTSYRIWATRGDSGESVLLEESSRPLTAPGWSPDGRALAFGRVVDEDEGRGRFEVVILEGPGRRRVVSSRPLPEISAEAARLPGQAIAWSPDGRYLAVPQLNPLGLAIIRADNGRQVNAINDAFLPSWSPDGNRLAFYIRGTGDTLNCLDSPLGQPRMLAEVGQAGPAPAWARDGLMMLVVARRPILKGVEAPGEQVEMLKVRVDTGQAEPIRTLSTEAVPGRDRPIVGVSIALDREGENLFFSSVVEGTPHEVVWCHTRDGSIYKRFVAIDVLAPLGSLSVSPDCRTLAARLGTSDHLSSPILIDLDDPDRRARLVAPDDATRVEWITSLVASARAILAGLPTPSVDPGAPVATRVDRPTLLPVLGEFESNADSSFRLRKIGRLGRPLCDRPADAPPADPGLVALLDEARLFFDYIREDYSAALASMEAMEDRADTPDRRARLLAVRAQVYLGQGNVDRAMQTIAYLRGLERKPPRRIEWTGAGYALSAADPLPGQGWPDYLAVRAEAVRAMLRAEAPDDPAELEARRVRFGFEPPPLRGNVGLPNRPLIEAFPPPQQLDRGGLPLPRPARDGPPGAPRR